MWNADGSTGTGLALGGVLLALACGGEGPRPGDDDPAGAVVEAPVPAPAPAGGGAESPPPRAPAPRPAAAPAAQVAASEEPASAAPPPPPGVRPLEDLLQLPPAPPPDRGTGRLLAEDEERPAGGGAKTGESPLEIRYESRTDKLGPYPSQERKSTDAGVAVGVGENTRVRGGVRVDEQPHGIREEPVPTVGIEKRF